MSDNNLKERRRGDYPYHLDYRTRFDDNDQYGHVNNSKYFHLFDSIINHYLIHFCGRQPATSQQIGLVVSSHCNYFSPLSFPSVTELALKVNKIGKSSVTYEVAVFEQGRDEPSAVGGYTHVFADRKTSRPQVEGMSTDIRKGLDRLLVTGRSAKL